MTIEEGRMLRIKLFGSGQANYYERRLEDFPHKITHLLLCYLLLNKQYPVNRERIAAVFWGNYPTKVARKYFRNTLWRLRITLQSLGMPVDQYLWIGEESISFINYSSYWLDVEVFEEIIDQFAHIPIHELDPDQVHLLEDAAKLYTGDLLETVYEDWCLYDRERLRLTYISLLGRLMEYYESRNCFEKSLLYGKQILQLDPTRENIHRQIIWLYWQNQDRSAALAQYKMLCQILNDELNVQPMESTRQLYESMLHDQISDKQQVPSDHQQDEWKDNLIGIHPMAKYTIKKLHHLQDTIEQANIELHQIEQMISKLLVSTSE
jgi:DNA-binding SARP family transcriptional activator